jgi:hypothetical protein
MYIYQGFHTHALLTAIFLFSFFVFLMSKRMRSMRSEALLTLSFCFPFCFCDEQTHAKHACGCPPHEQSMRVEAKHAYASPDTPHAGGIPDAACEALHTHAVS